MKRKEEPRTDDAKPKRSKAPGQQMLQHPKKAIIGPASSPICGDGRSRPRDNHWVIQKPKNKHPSNNRRSPRGYRRKQRSPSAARKEKDRPMRRKGESRPLRQVKEDAPTLEATEVPTSRPLRLQIPLAATDELKRRNTRWNSRQETAGVGSLILLCGSTSVLMICLSKPDNPPRDAPDRCRNRPGNTA